MKDKLGFTNYKKTDWHYGCKLTRKNFDEAVGFIERCNGGEVIADKKAGEIRFTTWGLGDRTAAIANLGDYLVRSGGDVKVYRPYKFKNLFTEVVNYRELLWYTPTEIEYRVLKGLTESDTDLCYPYSWLEDYTKVDRAETKKAMDNLRKLGVVSYVRGLMTDDGEVAGSGFGINDTQQQLLAELLVLRYEGRSHA